jgi:hypothetical protein
MAVNSYLLPEPCIVSFSGGRTSGYLLWRIIRAFGGKLPDWVKVVFNNTGKEREETLEFVAECSKRWNVPINWLEYRWEPGRHYFEQVDFSSASRKGEPFRQAIKAHGCLPNPVTRFCTVDMKIRTTNRFVKSLGWKRYHNAIGLRADEPRRTAKMLAKRVVTEEMTLFGIEKSIDRGARHPTGETPLLPLVEDGQTNGHVLSFWLDMPFDLRLPIDPKSGKTLGGNCDLCFLKGAGNLSKLIQADPSCADWWIETETLIAKKAGPGTGLFRADRPSYAEMKRIALGMVPGTFQFSASDGMDCGSEIECACTE